MSNHRGFPKKYNFKVFGADTETVDGEPWTIQLCDGKSTIVEFVNSKTILPLFLREISKRIHAKEVNLIYFHNLRFDFLILFRQFRQIFWEQFNKIEFRAHGWKFRIIFGKVNFAEAWGPTRKKFCLVDSMAFCAPGNKSLSAALKTYGVEGKKLPVPKNLGTRKLKNREFVKYAANDAEVERALGCAILELHREYDVSPCVSLPQLAGKVLRHRFFKKYESIPLPPPAVLRAAEFAYHAGKNGFYAKRGVYEKVKEYDINSAFPRAMRELPQMVRGVYEPTRRHHPGVLGVYEVRGIARSPRYPAIYDHRFRIIRGPFESVWVTGWEIDLLREDAEYDFEIRQGWIWKPDPAYSHSPLREFVDEFWHLKNTTPKGPKRDAYKNILNSLYGKFAGAIEDRKIIEGAQGKWIVEPSQKTFRAGALYHPFIAGQITGYVRREITRYERAAKAMHTATDSIKTLSTLPTSDDLGGLKLEVEGRCYLFRNKLYLHFAESTDLCHHDLKGRIIEGKQHLCKVGLHGFKGSVAELYARRFELLEKGYLDYDYEHMTSLREGFIRKETVCKMNRRKERLTLEGGPYA